MTHQTNLPRSVPNWNISPEEISMMIRNIRSQMTIRNIGRESDMQQGFWRDFLIHGHVKNFGQDRIPSYPLLNSEVFADRFMYILNNDLDVLDLDDEYMITHNINLFFKNYRHIY